MPPGRPPSPRGSTPAGSLPNAPAPGKSLKPGYRTTEFWLTAVLLAAYVTGVLGGFLSGQQGAACAFASATLYKGLRTWLKVAATGFSPATLAQQLDALDPVPGTDRLPPSRPSNKNAPLHFNPQSAIRNPQSTMPTPTSLLLPTLCALFLAGCAQPADQPYYLSGASISGYAKDDGEYGAEAGVTFAPNPRYPLPGTGGPTK